MTSGNCCGEALLQDATASTGTHFRSGGLGSALWRSHWLPPPLFLHFTGQGGILSILLDETTICYHFEMRLFSGLAHSRELKLPSLKLPCSRERRGRRPSLFRGTSRELWSAGPNGRRAARTWTSVQASQPFHGANTRADPLPVSVSSLVRPL